LVISRAAGGEVFTITPPFMPLVAEGAAFPPQTRVATIVEMPAVPEDYRPRGAANPYQAPCTEFDCATAK